MNYVKPIQNLSVASMAKKAENHIQFRLLYNSIKFMSTVNALPGTLPAELSV